MEVTTGSILKILVVDDSDSMREVLTTLLSLEGHQCESAANGREAMEKVIQGHFDVVITDVNMPEMDGITLTKNLTRYFTNLPVMVMTGQFDGGSRESALTAGARDVLGKPFAISELKVRLHKMLPVKERIQERRP